MIPKVYQETSYAVAFRNDDPYVIDFVHGEDDAGWQVVSVYNDLDRAVDEARLRNFGTDAVFELTKIYTTEDE